MKKNLVIGTLLISTIISAAAPALADKSDVSTILGGIAGAIAGSQVGKGNGNKAAIAVGAIVGALVGNKIGQQLEDEDRRAYQDAQRRCFDGDLGAKDWRGRQSSGNFRTTREGYRRGTSEICRYYESSIRYSNGYTENTTGYACRNSNGSWSEVQSTEVSFDGRGNDNSYGDRDRWDDNRPGRRDDRRDDYRPRPNQVRDVSERGEWIRLSLRSTFVTSVEVRGLGGDVRVIEAIAYPDYRREVPVNSRGGTIDVRVPDVSYINVFVKARGGSRRSTDVEFTVYSPRGPVFVEAERIGRR